jgi:hypothetical protein
MEGGKKNTVAHMLTPPSISVARAFRMNTERRFYVYIKNYINVLSITGMDELTRGIATVLMSFGGAALMTWLFLGLHRRRVKRLSE